MPGHRELARVVDRQHRFHDLVPLALFRLRNVATANAVGVLWAAAMFAWFFMSALYLQLVLGTARCASASPSCPRT